MFRSRLAACFACLCLTALIGAAESVGPFAWARWLYNPDHPQATAIGRNGDREEAFLVSGDATGGRIQLQEWQGDNQAGSRSFAGNALFGEAGKRWWIGAPQWDILRGASVGGEWIYTRRTAQHYKWHLGYAAGPADTLAKGHGAASRIGSGGFGRDAIVLELPICWMPGGGSAWQLGYYGGNPPQAGVWQVPAGSSLAAAQANQANRLADLGAVLGTFAPDNGTWMMDFAAGAGGSWELRIDRDGDGEPEWTVTSADAGCKPGLATVDGTQGLLMSLEAAGGNAAGYVGRTPVTIAYRTPEGIQPPEPVVGLFSPGEVPEGAGSADFTVRLSEPTTAPVLVTVSRQPVHPLPALSPLRDAGFAIGQGIEEVVVMTSPLPYGPSLPFTAVVEQTTLVIPAGETEAVWRLSIHDDHQAEPAEYQAVAITGAVGATIGAATTATLAVLDDDAAQPVGFLAATAQADEAAGTALVSVALAQPVDWPVWVRAQSDPASSDDVALRDDGWVEIPAGALFGDLVIDLVADAAAEGPETVALSLAEVVDATPGTPATCTLTIDDRPAVAIAVDAATVGEGAGSVIVRVRLDRAVGHAVTVPLALSGTATAGTDALAPAEVTIAAGASEAVVALAILDDAVVEGDETVVLTLGEPSGARLGTPTSATVTIVDDELGSVAFATPAATVGEDAGTHAIPVRLDRALPMEVSVGYTVTGSADAQDATIAAGPLVFAAGATEAVIPVTILQDGDVETAEEFVITLAAPTGVALAEPSRYVLTLLSDDLPAPVVGYVATTATTIAIYGEVPYGFDIRTLEATVVEPASGVTAIGTIDGDLFRAILTAEGAAPAGATVDLVFVDRAGHRSPATRVGPDQGGTFTPGGSTGDSTGLPPSAPDITAVITGGLTGDETGKVLLSADTSEDAHFSNGSAGAITWTASATTGIGVVESITVEVIGPGSVPLTNGGASVDGSFAAEAEGRYEIHVTATARKGDRTATAVLETPLVLYVDRTPPVVSYTLPTRHSLDDDRDIVLINANSRTEPGRRNADLRAMGFNVWNPSDLQVTAVVDDATGLSRVEAGTLDLAEAKAVTRKDYWYLAGGGSQTALTVTDATPAEDQYTTRSTLRLGAAGEWSGLEESIRMDSTRLKVASTAISRYKLALRLVDRCGNELASRHTRADLQQEDEADADGYRDQFKLWVDRTKPRAIPARQPYQQSTIVPGASEEDIAAGRTTVTTQLSHVRYLIASFDAALAWQDSVAPQNLMLRAYRGPRDLPDFEAWGSSVPSAWILRRPQRFPADQDDAELAVDVVVMDLAGNFSDSASLRAEREDGGSTTVGVGDGSGLDRLKYSRGALAWIADQPVMRDSQGASGAADSVKPDGVLWHVVLEEQDPSTGDIAVKDQYRKDVALSAESAGQVTPEREGVRRLETRLREDDAFEEGDGWNPHQEDDTTLAKLSEVEGGTWKPRVRGWLPGRETDQDANGEKVFTDSTVIVNPLDPFLSYAGEMPATGAASRLSPGVLNAPQSFVDSLEGDQTQKIRIQDEGLREILTDPENSGTVSVKVRLGTTDVSFFDGYLDDIDVVADRTRSFRDRDLGPELAATVIDAEQGIVEVTLSVADRKKLASGASRLLYRTVGGRGTYGMVSGYRWIRTIRFQRDTISTGQKFRICLSGPFLAEGVAVDELQADTCEVRFMQNGAVVSIDSTGLQPSAFQEAAITILSKRLSIAGGNASLVQQLVVEGYAGVELPPGYLDMTLNFGGIRVHTMSKAIAVYKVDCTTGFYVDSLARIRPHRIGSADSERFVAYAGRLGQDHPAAVVLRVELPNGLQEKLADGTFAIYEKGSGSKCIQLGDALKSDPSFVRLVASLHAIWTATPDFIKSLLSWEEPTVETLFPHYLLTLNIPSGQEHLYWQTPHYTKPETREYVIGRTALDAGPVIRVQVCAIALVADTNRDGSVDVDDVIDAKAHPVMFASGLGAVLLPNLDRDERKDRYASEDDIGTLVDWHDYRINGYEDARREVAKLHITKLSVAAKDLPETVTATLEMHNLAGDVSELEPGEKFKIFSGRRRFSQPILAEDITAYIWKSNPSEGAEGDIAQLCGHGVLQLGIEGWEPGTQIALIFTIKDGDQVIFKDEQTVLCAPFIFANSLDVAEKIILSESTNPGGKAVVDAVKSLPVPVATVKGNTNGTVNFAQDAFSYGWSLLSLNGFDEEVALRYTYGLQANNHSLTAYPNEELTGRDFGYYFSGLPHGTFNMGGNIMCLPPDPASEGARFGTVVYGAGIDDEFIKFVSRQGLYQMQAIDVAALGLGHIDELVAVVPGALVVADFALARRVLSQNSSVATDPGTVSVEQLVAEYLPENEVDLAALRDKEAAFESAIQALAAKAPAGFRVVRVPFLPRLPNPVNLLCVDGHVLIPDPSFAPFRNHIQTELALSGSRFVDTRAYHIAGGQIHCATNVTRRGAR